MESAAAASGYFSMNSTNFGFAITRIRGQNDSILTECQYLFRGEKKNRRLGGIALELSSFQDARTRFNEALPLYQQAGGKRGEANCAKRIAFVALSLSDRETARMWLIAALKVYEEISETWSVGMVHRELARLTSDTDERKSHVIAAIAAWEQIKRDDLIAEIKSEFGDIA